MTVTMADVNFMWQQVIMPRQGDIYVFGGSLNPQQLKVGTDCSGAVSEVNEALLYGPQMNWTRQFWTGTFAGANVGDRGPFGGVASTANWVCIADPRQPPAGCVMTVAVLQDPDPTQAHMVCAVQDPDNVTGFGGPGVYVGIESGGQFTDANGNSTLHIGPIATGVDDPEFNQYFALTDTIADGPPAPPPSPTPVTPLQRHALLIIEAGQALGITPIGLQMGLACAYAESDMLMYANSTVPESLNYPHDAVGNNNDSCGPFQQRPSQGWGTVAQEMNWTDSATMFFTALARTPYNDNTRSAGWRIQQVQRSADSTGSNYEAWWNTAVNLYNSVINAGDDMAAVPQAQWDQLFNALCGPVASESPFAKPGEGAIWTVPQLGRNDDGFLHPMYTAWAAAYGQPWALATLNTIAAIDVTANPGEAENVALAKAVLAHLAITPTPVPSPPAPTPTPTPRPPTPTPTPLPPGTFNVNQVIGWLKEALTVAGAIATWLTSAHSAALGLTGSSATAVPVVLAAATAVGTAHTVRQKRVAVKQLKTVKGT
jgi:hypothetical protein